MDPRAPGQATRRELLRRTLLTGAGLTIGPVLLLADNQVAAAQNATPAADMMRPGDGEMDDQLTIAVPIYWRGLDYRKLTDYNEWTVAALTYSALVRNDDQFQPIPDLAESWEQPDPQTIIFHLRSAKFHDGTDATSEDVKFTFDSIIDPDFGAPNRPLFAAIESVEAPDPATVIFHLANPSPALMAFLPWVGIVPKHYAEESPDLVASHPIGTGPYRFVSTIEQAETVLEAFEEYWGGMPAFRQITIRVVPEDTTRTVEVQTGNVDMATTMPLPDVEMLRSDSNLYVVEVAPNGYSYFGFDLRKPVLADLRVRQALAHAIDRDLINEAVYAGLGAKAIGPVVPSSWGFEPELTTYDYDPDLSMQLLAEAGHGEGLQLTMTSSNLPEHTQIATIMTEQLSDIGVQLEVTSVEFTVFTERVLAGEYGDIVLMFGWGQQMDPLQHMYRQFYSPNQPPNGYNFVFYENPEVDALLEEANTNTDVEARREAISAAQKILADELPYVFLFNVPSFWAVRNEVQNVTAPPPMDRQYIELAMHADRV
jgi:peptide/nickel transport system substrate-binding protein